MAKKEDRLHTIVEMCVGGARLSLDDLEFTNKISSAEFIENYGRLVAESVFLHLRHEFNRLRMQSQYTC